MRLIDADLLIQENANIIDCDIIHPKYEDTLREIIESAPTVTNVKENVSARWIGVTIGYKCSVCGFWIDDEAFLYLMEPSFEDGPNFCPNCGAKMKGMTDDEPV